MSDTQRKISAGQTLIAQPFMTDTNFKRSVVCICEHTKSDGTVGFILNKPINMDITELIGDVETEEKFSAYYGGPVATDTLHYIHNVGELLDESILISPGIYWGGDFTKLKFLIKTGLITNKNIRFYVGYSGWESGQIEHELAAGSWIVSDLYPNYIFKSKPAALWQTALGHKGDAYSVIAQIPNYISHN
jgi:putative transcriptional regulator